MYGCQRTHPHCRLHYIERLAHKQNRANRVVIDPKNTILGHCFRHDLHTDDRDESKA